MATAKDSTVPQFCGIYAGSNVSQNPHMKPDAKAFRKNLFSKLRNIKN